MSKNHDRRHTVPHGSADKRLKENRMPSPVAKPTTKPAAQGAGRTPTPGPWRVKTIHARTWIEAQGKIAIADIAGMATLTGECDADQVDANAEFIVRACNSFDALLAAARAAEELLDRIARLKGAGGFSAEFCDAVADKRDQLRAAIAAAETKGELP